MKALILTFALLFSTHTQAGQVKELYTRTVEEIEINYHVYTDYDVENVYDLKFVPPQKGEIHISAKVDLRNEHTGKTKTETCIVEYYEDNLDYIGMTCK